MLATIGVLAALIQGGYTRRAINKTGEGTMARNGVISSAIGFLLLASLPHVSPHLAARLVYISTPFLAFTSATVVSSLTALASLQCDEDVTSDGGSNKLAKGRALGEFRSSGQLGRAIGPLLGKNIPTSLIHVLMLSLACALYWTFGPSLAYSTAGALMLSLAVGMGTITKKT